MKITICGSIAFYDQMLIAKKQLEELGHEVKLPPTDVKDENGDPMSVADYYQKRKTAANSETWVWQRKKEAIDSHFDKIAWSDSVLVLNYDKKGVPGYVGGNTLMEMGVAFFLKKPIFFLNPIPELSYKEEILGMWPIVLNGDLSKINSSSL